MALRRGPGGKLIEGTRQVGHRPEHVGAQALQLGLHVLGRDVIVLNHKGPPPAQPSW